MFRLKKMTFGKPPRNISNPMILTLKGVLGYAKFECSNSCSEETLHKRLFSNSSNSTIRRLLTEVQIFSRAKCLICGTTRTISRAEENQFRLDSEKR
jgi:hypothetical protein